MEEFKIFKFGEFHISKKEGDIIHSLLTEEFFKHGFEAMKLIEIYATFPKANAEI